MTQIQYELPLLWKSEFSVAVVRSTLALAELQDQTIEAKAKKQLQQRGVVAAFRTYRILVGKTPNFTPAQRVV